MFKTLIKNHEMAINDTYNDGAKEEMAFQTN